MLVTFAKLENGNLRIEIVDNEARAEIEEISQNGKGINEQFAEIIEYQLGEEWSFIRPEEVAALTSSPILSDSAIYDDYGEIVEIGDLWWHPNYAVINEVEELLTYGYIDFDLADTWEENAA